MKRIVALVALVLGLTACTPGEAIWWAFHDLGNETVAKANRVAHCESRLNPSVISPGGGNWGLFQINTVHRNSGRFTEVTGQPWSEVLNPVHNAFYARNLYNQLGWQPWPVCGKR